MTYVRLTGLAEGGELGVDAEEILEDLEAVILNGFYKSKCKYINIRKPICFK